MEYIADENDLGLLNQMPEEAHDDASVLRTTAALAFGGLLAAALLLRVLGPFALRSAREAGGAGAARPRPRARRVLGLLAPVLLGVVGIRAAGRSRRSGYPRRARSRG